jgi:acyl-CoA reductase-like NAD-dependent aldehyde dehydrogenase
MWIDHRQMAARSGRTIKIENPTTKKIIGAIPRASVEDVTHTVDVTRRKQSA